MPDVTHVPGRDGDLPDIPDTPPLPDIPDTQPDTPPPGSDDEARER